MNVALAQFGSGSFLAMPAPAAWTDEIDEILAGDLAAGLAYLTPARGVVITPMAPLGLRDREAGTVTVTTSLAMWKKLDRIRRRSGVALVYHAREHGFSDRPGFVVVQGRATFERDPDRQWLESITPQWERFLGPRARGPVGRMLDVYYWQRVAVRIAVERVVAWSDDRLTGRPASHGAPHSAPAPPQREPGGGTGSRVAPERLATDVMRLPHALLGWCGADEMPEVVPVHSARVTGDRVALEVPAGAVPAGGRRAGVTAHEFHPRMIGQEQRVYTGWLEADRDRATYAPHTRAGYRLPRSKTAFLLGSASLVTRMRASRRAGIAR